MTWINNRNHGNGGGGQNCVPLGSSRPSYSRSRSRSRSRSPRRRLGLQIKISHLRLHLQLQLSLLCCLGNQPHVPLNLHILLLLRVVQHRTLAPVLLQQRCQLTRLHLDHLLIVVYNVLFSVLSLYPAVADPALPCSGPRPASPLQQWLTPCVGAAG